MSTIPTATTRETLLERICADMPPMPDPACKDNPELFFGTDSERERNAAAKQLCGTCPVLEPCLTWALTHSEHGVWGGMTVKERNKIRRRNQPAERRRRKR